MARRGASLCVQSTEEPAAREVKNKCIEPSALARYDRIQLALINKQVQIIGREDATSQSPLAVSKENLPCPGRYPLRQKPRARP